MRIVARIAPIVAAAALVLGAASCGGTKQATTAPAPVRTTAATGGESIYRNSCARCHGLNLEGNAGKGAAKIDAVKMASLSDQMMTLLIRNGKGTMPAFGGLTQFQVDELIAYLRSMV